MTLNIPPIRPINNLGGGMGGIRPSANNLRGIGSPRSAPKSAFDKLDIDRIGKGRLMIEGSYHKQLGGQKFSGLKGQLSKLKMSGKRTVTKNLSTENIKQMHDLIADRLKKKVVGSQIYISKRDKMAIMKESRQLVKTKDSHFTWADRKDLKKTVDTMQKQYRDKVLHREDGTDPFSVPTSSITDKDIAPLNLEPTNNFAGNTALPPKVSALDNSSSRPPGGIIETAQPPLKK